MNKTLGTLALAGSLLMALLVAAPASAHTCAAYDGCDASACTEGEDHDHTDFNYFTRDEHCASHAPPPPPPEGSCKYNGIEFPKKVCDIIEGASKAVDSTVYGPVVPETPLVESPLLP
jgi:hypothetical protein